MAEDSKQSDPRRYIKQSKVPRRNSDDYTKKPKQDSSTNNTKK